MCIARDLVLRSRPAEFRIAFDALVEWMAQELTDLAKLVSREQQRESESA